MKKIMSLMLGLSLVLGTASMFAQSSDTTKTTKSKKSKKAKKADKADTTKT